MKVIPAIDLKDGQCVRLQKGDYGTAHKVAENAVETARRFLEAGASLIHMVDLDAAKDGSHANYGVVEQILTWDVRKVIIGTCTAVTGPMRAILTCSLLQVRLSARLWSGIRT